LDGDPNIHARSVPSFRTSQLGDGELPLGDEFVISAAAGGQYIPTIACETDRPYCLVAWQDNRNAEWLFTDIMGYLVRADTGSTIGDEIQVAAESDFQYSPVVAFNPVSSEYLVVWDDDISCRRVSRDGQLLGRKIYVSLESPHQYKPAVAVGEDGTYLIVWEDLRNLNDRLADIFGQWLSSTGQPQGANFALSEDPNNQYSPTVVAGQGWGQESFLILWEDDRTSEAILSLYGRWLPVGSGGE
jgi:hypothetical protein